MNLKSCNCHFDGVLFGFYGGLVNDPDLLLFGSGTLLRETRYGGTNALDPYLLQNLTMVVLLVVAFHGWKTSKNLGDSTRL